MSQYELHLAVTGQQILATNHGKTVKIQIISTVGRLCIMCQENGFPFNAMAITQERGVLQSQFPSTATTRILTPRRLVILDLLGKVRNCLCKIQIFAQALSCQNLRGERFVDQDPPPPCAINMHNQRVVAMALSYRR